MLINQLSLKQVELALEYLADQEQKEPPLELQDLDPLEWLTLQVLQVSLMVEKRNSSVH